jgi:hypothetical protein
LLLQLISAMPVQSAFTLLIIGGAIAAAGGLLGTVNYFSEGKRRRSTGLDDWSFQLEERDRLLEAALKKEKKLG